MPKGAKISKFWTKNQSGVTEGSQELLFSEIDNILLCSHVICEKVIKIFYRCHMKIMKQLTWKKWNLYVYLPSLCLFKKLFAKINHSWQCYEIKHNESLNPCCFSILFWWLLGVCRLISKWIIQSVTTLPFNSDHF